MKIKVKPEGREGIYIPNKDSLKIWLKDKGWKYIHNFVGGGSMFIGADHSIEGVFDDIDRAERIGLVLKEAVSMDFGHALVMIIDNKRELYDIGNITTEDLEIEA